MATVASEKVSPLNTGINLATLEAHVQTRLAGRVRSFRVELLDCGLILRGSSSTYHAKQLAQHAVMARTEIPIVANEIKVI